MNLTRFSLFFPEKREFFLENRSTFEFGGGGSDTPILFHSRLIGIQEQEHRVVPVRGGGRLTGRIGGFDLGVIRMRTGAEEVSGALPTDFSVVRLKRNILRSSSIGVVMTRRSVSLRGPGPSGAYGIDGGFSFLDNRLTVDTCWARTETPEASGNESSWRANVGYDGDRYGFRAERLAIGDDFRPEVGFVRRRDMARSMGRFRFSPRLLSVPAIRKLVWIGGIDYIENGRGQLETREGDVGFTVELENSDQFGVRYARSYEHLLEPFPITEEISIATGSYAFDAVQVQIVLGAQRAASGRIRLEHGAFFNGRKTDLAFTRGRPQLTPRVSAEPTQPGGPAGGDVHDAPRRVAHHLHGDAADVHQRADPVQLVEPHHGCQHPLPVGVSAGQRVVRRVQRPAEHAGAAARATPHREPRGGGQADPAVPLLTPGVAAVGGIREALPASPDSCIQR